MEANGIDDVKIPLLQTPPEESVTVRTVLFQISDIKCASCVNSIESVVRNLNGVKSIAVSPLDGRAAIKFVPKLITVSVFFDFSLKDAFELVSCNNNFSHHPREFHDLFTVIRIAIVLSIYVKVFVLNFILLYFLFLFSDVSDVNIIPIFFSFFISFHRRIYDLSTVFHIYMASSILMQDSVLQILYEKSS